MDTQEDDRLIVVALQVADCDFDPAEGSTRGHLCATCEAEVWLSPMGRDRVADGGLVWCSRCAMAGGQAIDLDHVIPPTDQQMAELAKRMARLGLPAPTREEVLASIRRRFAAARAAN